MKRRVAFISEHASPLALLGGVDSGGQNVYVDQVARHLTKSGFEVDVFTRWDNPATERIVKYAPGIRVIHVKAGPVSPIPKEEIYPFTDDFAGEMILLMREFRLNYEVVHAHFFMSGYVAMQIKKVLKIPYVITFHALGKVRIQHQGNADKFPAERVRIEERVAANSDFVIAECPQDKEDLMIHYCIAENKIVTIPCGFDRKDFYPEDKRQSKIRLGLDPDEFVVLQLGRMVPRKGVDNVIRAMPHLIQKIEKPVHLLVVGGESEEPDPQVTPEIGRLMQIAREADVSDNVTFVGRRGRKMLKFFYNAADVFVSTPWYEPFGITPLEAMACGTPVIGSNVGGLKYTISHGKTGFLVPANEPEVLSERLVQLASDPVLYNEMRNKAIERVNKLFTWEKITKEIAGVYDLVRRSGRETERKLPSFFTGKRGSLSVKTIFNTTNQD
jgi:D-inositol-3-phosphate glycosyltransferase